MTLSIFQMLLELIIIDRYMKEMNVCLFPVYDR